MLSTEAMNISRYYKPLAATIIGTALSIYGIDKLHDYIARYGLEKNGIKNAQMLVVSNEQPNTSDNVVYFFSHGLADNHNQALRYLPSVSSKFDSVINYPCTTFDYPDVSYSFLRINRKETSLAQNNEIEKLATAFEQTIPTHQDVVLMGISRGASTILNFMALNNPANVKALVLESPYDCMESVITDKINRLGIAWLPAIQCMSLALTRFVFSKYTQNGIRPADIVHKIRHNLPILIICSQQDQLVPVSSSMNLYTILKNSGHEHVYVLKLPEGKHAKLFNSLQYGLQYKQVTHAFYKKYGLPHDEKLAFEGEQAFVECRPNLETNQTKQNISIWILNNLPPLFKNIY